MDLRDGRGGGAGLIGETDGQPASLSDVVEQHRPAPRRSLAGGHVEDEVPRPSGGQGEVQGVHAVADVEGLEPGVRQRLVEPLHQGSPLAAHDDRDPGRPHAGHRGARDLRCR